VRILESQGKSTPTERIVTVRARKKNRKCKGFLNLAAKILSIELFVLELIFPKILKNMKVPSSKRKRYATKVRKTSK
jgi:hypothetical protein